MSRAKVPRAVDAWDGTPSLSAGVLAALPLFLAYELGLVVQADSSARAPAEVVVARVLFLFGGRLQGVRCLLLALVAVLAILHVRRTVGTEGAVLPRVVGAIAWGVLAGFLLGPTLVGLQAWLGAEALANRPEDARSLPATLRLIGAAPWEELLFRVGLYGVIFLLVRRVCAFLGLEARLDRLGAEFIALLASAVLFAAFHLESVQRLLWGGGEPFHRGLFLWRTSAGILLGALFRWRGFGVAAWAHAIFNLGIALGIRA